MSETGGKKGGTKNKDAVAAPFQDSALTAVFGRAQRRQRAIGTHTDSSRLTYIPAAATEFCHYADLSRYLSTRRALTVMDFSSRHFIHDQG